MTKVLYVFGGEKASGAEIVIERLISYNLDTVEPHLFISPGKFADELIAQGKTYPVITVNRLRKLNRSSTSAFRFFYEAIKNYFIISAKVIKYINKNQIRFIHANTIVPASYLIPAIIYCRFFGNKKYWIWSDHDLQYFSKLDNIFSSLCSSLFDITLTVSEAVKRKYGIKKGVHVLYNGLDVNVFRSDQLLRNAFRSKINLENNLILGIAATFSPRKGQLELIKVFEKIGIHSKKITLLLAGGLGNDDIAYNNEVKEAIKGTSNIKYIGYINNMVEFCNGCDILINNSSLAGSEPLGTTIYEAMACEKIVVASDTGGTPEIISQGKDGFIFKANDVESLHTSLNYAIANINALQSIRTMARKKVIEKFSLETMTFNYNKYILSNLN